MRASPQPTGLAHVDLQQELAALLGAGIPLVHLVTYEEERVVRLLEGIERAEGLGLATWDAADGFSVIREGREPFPVKDCTSDTVLPHLAEKMPPGGIVVLRDFHHAWSQKRGYVTRKLRNMAPELRAKSQFLFFTSPVAEVPVELKDDLVVVHVPLPTTDELDLLFETVTARLPRDVLPAPPVRAKLIASALGLTTNQARLAFSRVMARYERFDERGIEVVTWAKREIIRESGALEFWPISDADTQVGGLDVLREWLKKRALAYTPEARRAKVPFPRGVVLIGIPGTGKSLTAKLLSQLWRMPLLRLDVGAVFGALVGESEKNMRRAIELAETVSPCILWIDEMEKAFAGSSTASAHLSSGVGTRVFGTFLTWMQEHRSPVFVLATANEIAGLPPELIGRFDRTFFLDLPTESERRQVFAIHLKKAGEAFPERRFDLGALAHRAEGFVGREIERVVREAQFTALAGGNREIEEDDLTQALEEVVPLSRSHREVIDGLRRWVREGRAFPASGA